MSTLAGSFAPGYSPTQVPVSVDALPGWLSDEMQRVASAITSVTGFIPLVNAAPDKPRDGLVRATDATAWNPGGGAGIYAYYSGTWNRLIEIASSATIADGAVTTAKLADLAVTTGKLVDLSVNSAKLADLAVTLNKLGSGAVDTSKLSDAAVTAIKIADGSITLAKHSTGLRPVQVGAVLPTLPDANYPSGAVYFLTTDFKLYRSDGTNWTKAVDGGDITASTITAGAISAGAIGTTALAAGAVTTAKIFAGAVTTTELGAQAVTTAKLAAGSVTATEIATGTITATQIATGTITANQIAASTITAGKMSVSTLSSIAADLGSITAGSINIGSGKFTVSSAGIVSIVSATTGARLTIANSVIKVYDSTGTLRVQIGDLLA